MSAPVKHTCPDIDRLQNRIKDAIRDLQGISDELEDLRGANQSLREWGEGLDKDLADAADQIYELEEQLKEKA